VLRGLRPVDERVEDLPHRADGLFAFHFQVGNRAAEHRIPIDEALAAVDQARLVPADEYLRDRARHLRVHREVAGLLSLRVRVGPVAGVAEAPHLARDGRAGLLFPFPDALHERLAAKVALALALVLDL